MRSLEKGEGLTLTHKKRRRGTRKNKVTEYTNATEKGGKVEKRFQLVAGICPALRCQAKERSVSGI